MTANHTAGLWWTRIAIDPTDDGIIELRGYDTADYEPGTVLTVATPDISPLVVAHAKSDATRVLSLLVVHGDVAPTLWWVERHQPAVDAQTASLVAYVDDAIPASSVIDYQRFRTLGIAPSSRIGEVRWSLGTGQVRLIRVAAERRRQGVGTALVFAAEAHSKLCGGPPLWGAARRSSLGDAFATQGHAVIAGRVEPSIRA
jgi:GNAT superfamily N-acetyltransferase